MHDEQTNGPSSQDQRPSSIVNSSALRSPYSHSARSPSLSGESDLPTNDVPSTSKLSMLTMTCRESSGELDFEAQRELNIARNRALIEQLGIKPNEVIARKKPQPKPKAAKPPKRKVEVVEEGSEDEKPAAKVAVVPAEGESGGVRRSGRNVGKQVNYAADGDKLGGRAGPRVVSEAARRAERYSEPKSTLNRKHDPRTYGSIPGIEVGTWWETRQACSVDAIHAPWVAGIAPGPDGCYSVALSGGYEDDVDAGEAFTYTGSGGRDLKGTKNNPKNLRTAPQSSDQTFENNFNNALLMSVETKRPVRVIRGYKLKSKYAPTEGYRYDGLYTVEKAWMERGLNSGGFKVCKFLFKRIEGQPPLPIYTSEGGEEDDDDETSETEATAVDDAGSDSTA
ncbi:hypothetical protein NM688_g5305 [Phlebia brevispora]|uniref:Uncharacterized protein n=1 Tax=Phlebia brevispora TaxID=194682 RepID=A0ACC1SXJ8_9APHY|nr:hypothetical protein NM688_g5305 [Phlebia brevispora]